MAINNSGILWMGETAHYRVLQITDTGATSLLGDRSYPHSSNNNTQGLATDGVYVYAYDAADNGYYRYPIIDAATGELGTGTLFSVTSLANEQGVSLATIPDVVLTDTFINIRADDTRLFRLIDGSRRVDIRYLRQPDGAVRIVLASDSNLLPNNAVVKLYAAAQTLGT